MNLDLWVHLAVYLHSHLPSNSFWMPEPIFTKLGMYIMAPKTSTAYFINTYHQSLCLYVYVARQRLVRNVTDTMSAHAIIKQFWEAAFSTWSVSCQRRAFEHLCIAISLLENFAVNTFSRQQGIVAGVVFYLLRVVSKEGRRLTVTQKHNRPL
jgi:hypothetical protein